MKHYKNNQKRNRFRGNGDRGFKRNGSLHKLNNDFNNVSEFKRRNPGKNNQNATKLIEKYNDLAREAVSNGDKILSENYFQHADHFTRILNDQESQRKARFSENKLNDSVSEAEELDDKVEENKIETINNVSEIKPPIKKNTESN